MKKSIAILLVALMALTVLSTAGVVTAAPPQHRGDIVGRLVQERGRERDEQHRNIGFVVLTKDRRDTWTGHIYLDRQVERGRYDLFAEKRIGRDWTRDVFVKGNVRVDRGHTEVRNISDRTVREIQDLRGRELVFELVSPGFIM